jgi:hypothetical protein
MDREKKSMSDKNHQPNCMCPPCRGSRGDASGSSPRLSIRIKSELKDWVMDQPEGARQYLSKLIRQDKELKEQLG